MIELSPLDVRKKKDDFARSIRGYDVDQVDSFLDLAADRLEELVSERRRLGERVEALEDQLADYREREQALNEALLAAQELREEARSQAEKDAELRREEAEAKAKEIVRQARERAEDLRRQIADLRQRKDRFLHSLKGTLRRFSDELEVEEVRLGEEEGADAGPGEADRRDPIPTAGGEEEAGTGSSGVASGRAGEEGGEEPSGAHQVEIQSGEAGEDDDGSAEEDAPGRGDGTSGPRDGAA